MLNCQIVFIIVVNLLTTSLIYLHITNEYSEMSSLMIDSPIDLKQYAIVKRMIANSSGTIICNDRIVYCFKKISDYLANNIFGTLDTNCTFEIQVNWPNNEEDPGQLGELNERFVNLFRGSNALLGITIAGISVLIIIQIFKKTQHFNKWLAIYFSSMMITWILLMYDRSLINELTNYGFAGGARIHRLDACYNNIDCYNKIYKTATSHPKILWVTVDQINEYTTAFDIQLVLSFLINVVSCIYMAIEHNRIV